MDRVNETTELPPLFLEGWETITLPGKGGREVPYLKLTATGGAHGYSKLVGRTEGISAAASFAEGRNLVDHDALYDAMVAAEVPEPEAKILDIACWDLHARLLEVPLHRLLGTKKDRILRYGDVRGRQPGFDPETYASKVKGYFEETGLRATKLHFPGTMGTEDSISYTEVMETLRAVREAVGYEKILAWDPFPRTAESATASVEEAEAMIRLMDSLHYAWIEGPLPPVPYETQIPKYVELMNTRPRLRIQAEGFQSPIGDGTRFEDCVRWAEAGAINQCSTDAYIRGGVTHARRVMEYARDHREHGLVINLHWAWAPHAHLVMAYEDDVCPMAEFPGGEDIPPDYLDGPWLRAPDWPGIYRVQPPAGGG